MGITIKQIMTSPVISVNFDSSLGEIRKIFADTHLHHVLVIEDNQVYGIISDRDLLRSLSPNLDRVNEKASDAATLNIRAHQIMTRHPTMLHPENTALSAVDIMYETGHSCLPVVDDKNRPIGIVSWRDILKIIRAKSEKSHTQK
jgi:acetoin utilization protein AcuB